jgi:hypothetical protein
MRTFRIWATGFIPLLVALMLWFLWALMLVAHGAFSRWVQTRSRYALASIFGDVLLIAIGFITLNQLLILGIADIVRIGLFFAAFGYCGRELMNALLGHPSKAR